MRLGLVVGGIALVAVVGGCTSKSASPTWNGSSASAAPAPAVASGGSAPPFSEPASYTYTLIRGCDESSPLGRYQVTVQAGAVTGFERIGSSQQPASAEASAGVDLGPIAGQDGEEIEVPTLGELREMAQTAADDGGEVSTTYDARDGHPLKVVINVSDEGPSGAECFTVAGYQP
ncbi:hypothetical protein ACQP2F_10630 [Actinoplanes sp. CA-030573]|uniref:hypothetical protein n=1 Tax=Actinoplanes sp. CA-030573 TaxID=3239898 RepID=UPI003D8A1766